MSIYMEIDDVVETLRQAKGREKCSTLLIGAGCSATAGIPTATQFVEIIKTKYPRSYERAKLKDYPNCMAQLSLAERRDLIAAHIDKSKINWAHIGIAQLIKHGYVDRVLTTNFDQLVVKSCAMINIFPAVYDFASSQLFKPADVPDQAIFYLHGQRTGFKLMNTGDECSELSGHFAPVFEDAGKKRVWIVAGYSGECDPVFEHLAKVERFDNRLFWIGYRDEEPSHHVREKLLLPGKDAHFVKGFDADSFFITLAQRLECFPPNFIGSPFTHLDELLDMLIEFPVENGAGVDIVANARDNIRGAIARFETPTPADSTRSEQEGIVAENVAQEAAALFSAGKYAELIKLAGDLTPPYRGIPLDQLYWAYILEGNEFYAKAQREPVHHFEEYAQAIQLYSAAASLNKNGHEAFYNWGLALFEQARTKSGGEADRLFDSSYTKFSETVRIKPDMHEAFNNWGNTLSHQAKSKHGNEADRLFDDAYAKYAKAIQIKPDKHEALNNWGLALSTQARTKSGDEADRLFDSSYTKFSETVRIKPDMHEAFNNWGLALSHQAINKHGNEADRLFDDAYAKYAKAIQIKPDKHEALNNWGLALSTQARTKSGDEADRLFDDAYAKFAKAIRIKQDMHEAFNNWGLALSHQAINKHGNEADQLFDDAYAKYAKAIQIKPDKHEALNDWGLALSHQAKSKHGNEADRLFESAHKQFKQAEQIKTGHAAYNLACLSALRGNSGEALQWLARSKEAGKLPSRDHIDQDTDLDSIRMLEEFQQIIE